MRGNVRGEGEDVESNDHLHPGSEYRGIGDSHSPDPGRVRHRPGHIAHERQEIEIWNEIGCVDSRVDRENDGRYRPLGDAVDSRNTHHDQTGAAEAGIRPQDHMNMGEQSFWREAGLEEVGPKPGLEVERQKGQLVWLQTEGNSHGQINEKSRNKK